ncbi:MAG: hypothetical protein LBU12_00985 [Deltaproteobacteria bacterium]|jgi:exopolyphosphatase/guanosine-5'-triphosphate,3'-diphosphate pyrophosphatase|nr:hypothetical protein [Deltaproteobacteria bacterium]
MSDLLAALDLGSNTFRLLLAPADPDVSALAARRVWQEFPRLSEGLKPGGRLGAEPLQRAWAALDAFEAVLAAERPRKVLAGATMFARQAADGPEFLAEAARRYGWETTLLSGTQEAFLSAAGVLSSLAPRPSEALIFDVGGRSTEFVKVEGGRIVQTQSLELGVVGLTEQFVSGAPARPEELAAVAAEVRRRLAAAVWRPLSSESILAGTAGTVTTVTAMLLKLPKYDPALINNSVVERQAAETLLAELAAETLERRHARVGLHPKRADVIVAGLAEVVAVLDFFQKDRLTVSDGSLLEGLWLAAAGLTPLEPPSFETPTPAPASVPPSPPSSPEVGP